MAMSLIQSRKVEGKEDTDRYDSADESLSDKEVSTRIVKNGIAGKRWTKLNVTL